MTSTEGFRQDGFVPIACDGLLVRHAANKHTRITNATIAPDAVTTTILRSDNADRSFVVTPEKIKF